ncbi:MAG TPA: hypothetical protein VHM88_15500, partial [Candidatus Acidoferrales bacterium]|nr:hypothetical protein [Candidatus Acidoferrales bacterium]
MSASTQVATEKMIFRKTNAHVGRHIAVTPDNSSNKHLAYGRIILNHWRPSVSFSTQDRETGLICLSGEASVKVGEAAAQLGRYDAIYIPRDCSVEVSTKTSVDF